MGFKYFLIAISQSRRQSEHGKRKRDLIIISNRYSWLLIIFTVANSFCFVTREQDPTRETRTKSLDFTTTLSTSTSTVRPWPSHEFFQNVLNERPSTLPTGNSSSKTIVDSSIYKEPLNLNLNDKKLPSSLPLSTVNTSTTAKTQRENKQLNTTSFNIHSNKTITNFKNDISIAHTTNSTIDKIDKFQIVKEMSMDVHKEIGEKRTSNPNSTKSNERFWTNDDKKIPLDRNPNLNENINLKRTDKGIKSDQVEFEETINRAQLESQVKIGEPFILKKSPNPKVHDKNSKDIREPPRPGWISIISTTSSSSSSSSSSSADSDVEIGKKLRDSALLPPIVQTNGELSFRVNPVKKLRQRTELSPEFYAKLRGDVVNHENDGHKDTDYVNDDKLEWWSEIEKEKYSMSTVKPPNFARLKWPYTSDSMRNKNSTRFVRPNQKFQNPSTFKRQQIPFPIITAGSSSSSPSHNRIQTSLLTNRPIMTTSVSADILNPSSTVLFSSVQQHVPTTQNAFVKNKISSSVHHWGSSGSQQIINSSPVGSDAMTRRPQTEIKLSTDITSTSTDSSVMTQFSQVLLSPVVEDNNEEHNNNFHGGFGEPNLSLRGPTKTPTNIWYKPVINHHYSTSSSRVPFSAPPKFQNWNQFVEKNEQNEQKKEKEKISHSDSDSNSSSTSSLSRHETLKDTEDKEQNKEEIERDILFKLWNVANGTLQLNNEKSIPSWILKDFDIENDQVLNLNELPIAVQKMVQDRFLTVSGKSDVDGYWQQLPIVQPTDENSEHQYYEAGMPQMTFSKKRRPIALNYVLWNDDDDPPPPKSPHDFLMKDQVQHSPTPQLQNYLQHFLKNPNPYFQGSSESNWGKLDTYLKDQAASSGGRIPYSSLLDFSQPPNQYPWNQKFEDKDISNLVAVSLILSYLDKNKHESLPSFVLSTPRPEISGNSQLLFTSPLPTKKDPNWNAIRSVLKHTKPFNDHKQEVEEQDNFPFSSFSSSASAPISMPASAPSPSLRPPSYLQLFDTMTNDGDNVNNVKFEQAVDTSINFIPPEQQTASLKPPKNSVTLERGETSEIEQQNGDVIKHILTKKKLHKKHKKHRKKFKKKKGTENYGLNFEVGGDLADLLKKKFLALMSLQYAPFIVLLLAMLGPTLMISSPYIMQAMKSRFRNGFNYNDNNYQDEFHYIYPYNYAYPVLQQATSSTTYDDQVDYPSDHHSFDDQIQTTKMNNFGRGGGRVRNVRSRKKNVEIHHHFHDIPFTSSTVGVQQPLTFSPTYPLATGSQSQYGSSNINNQYDGQYGNFIPFNPNSQNQKQPLSFNEPLSSSTNDADSYMKKIRDIGKNLGILIGSQISDNEAMKSIIDGKKDAISQMIQNWSMFSPSPSGAFRAQYRDSEEDEFYRKKLQLQRQGKG